MLENKTEIMAFCQNTSGFGMCKVKLHLLTLGSSNGVFSFNLTALNFKQLEIPLSKAAKLL